MQSVKHYLLKLAPGSISAILQYTTLIDLSLCLSDQEVQRHFYRNWLWTTTARATGQKVKQVYTFSSSVFVYLTWKYNYSYLQVYNQQKVQVTKLTKFSLFSDDDFENTYIKQLDIPLLKVLLHIWLTSHFLRGIHFCVLCCLLPHVLFCVLSSGLYVLIF